MSKNKRQECFVNGHCCYDCPNFEIQTVEERYGAGIADDMGLEEVECKNCYYNSGECKNCLLENSPDCPKYRQELERVDDEK